VASWFISPALGSLIAFAMFFIIKSYVLTLPDPDGATKQVAPFLTIPGFMVPMLCIIFKGLKPSKLHL
jgi:phosphate/sulfate permease